MAIPTGTGTEVAYCHRVEAVSDSWVDLIPVADINVNIISTLMSVVITNTDASICQVSLAIHNYNGSGYSGESRFLYTQVIGTGNRTFVWDTRMVLFSASASTRPALRAITEATGDVDVYTSYIKQDWT